LFKGTCDVKTEWENYVVEHEDLVLAAHGSDDAVDDWLRSDDTGIYRVASKSDRVDAEPKVDAPRRYVLKTPPAAGNSWQATTTAHLLRRRAGLPRDLRHTHPPITMPTRSKPSARRRRRAPARPAFFTGGTLTMALVASQ
jgi:hypothetical protein